MKKIVYLDMDGVLVDFASSVSRFMGIKHFQSEDGIINHACKKWHEYIENNIDGGWDKLAETIDNSEGLFWMECDYYSWTSDLYYLIKSLCDENGAHLHILTSTLSNDKFCEYGKKMWIEELTRDVGRVKQFNTITFIGSGIDKSELAKPYSFLIDDRDDVVKSFIEKGGFGFSWVPFVQKRKLDAYAQIMELKNELCKFLGK